MFKEGKMSEWHEVKEEDIDIDGDMVNIHIGTNYQGAIYVEIPIAILKKKLDDFYKLKGE